MEINAQYFQPKELDEKLSKEEFEVIWRKMILQNCRNLIELERDAIDSN